MIEEQADAIIELLGRIAAALEQANVHLARLSQPSYTIVQPASPINWPDDPPGTGTKPWRPEFRGDNAAK